MWRSHRPCLLISPSKPCSWYIVCANICSNRDIIVYTSQLNIIMHDSSIVDGTPKRVVRYTVSSSCSYPELPKQLYSMKQVHNMLNIRSMIRGQSFIIPTKLCFFSSNTTKDHKVVCIGLWIVCCSLALTSDTQIASDRQVSWRLILSHRRRVIAFAKDMWTYAMKF